MKIISFDVGIKNLAYIIFDCIEDNIKIIEWDIICLVHSNQKCNTINLIDLGKNISNEFNVIFKNKDVDKIIIENQIGNNAIRMKCIQGMIAQWFIDNDFNDIEFVSSSHKLNYIANLCNMKDLFKNLQYKDKKKMAIIIIKSFLNENSKYFDEYIKEFFYTNKKKDDLADCFLQGYYYIKKYNLFKNNLIINAYDLKL
tara:strand:+ start:701 stop:1297 length:597 start_codon:yes stop_codon:yes gene_type:complete